MTIIIEILFDQKPKINVRIYQRKKFIDIIILL